MMKMEVEEMVVFVGGGIEEEGWMIGVGWTPSPA